MRFVFVSRFMRELRAYVTEMEAMHALVSSAADTAAAVASRAARELHAEGSSNWLRYVCRRGHRGRRGRCCVIALCAAALCECLSVRLITVFFLS